MIGDESVLAIIPARGGSKRLPRKNLRELGGKPLIAWTVEAARGSRYIDRIVLSSEDEEIMRVGRDLGCDVPFARPAALATDEAPGIAPVLDALARLPGFAWVVLLQPTSPLRRARDVDACINACVERRAPACVSVAASEKSPWWMYTLGADRTLAPLLTTEEPAARPAVFLLNGAVYVARTDWLQREQNFVGPQTVAYVMPPERSVDIDSELDLKYARLLLQETTNGTLR